VRGLGETFTPDLQSGTGNLVLPIATPAGRNGFQPDLRLSYSTGQGNGPVGLGWVLAVPAITRLTARGVPRYRPGSDTFVLAGAENLVPVEDLPGGAVRYRPRTEGLYARIVRYGTDGGAGAGYWEVTSKDGLTSRYGTVRPAGAERSWRDPAATADPDDPARVFGWALTRTVDRLGNTIEYEYGVDAGAIDGHRWHRPLLSGIRWADNPDPPSFLARLELAPEPRPDPFSTYTSGFEVRTTLRYRCVRTYVVDGDELPVRRYELRYEQDGHTGVSLLTAVAVVGFDAAGLESRDLPPIRLGYDRLDIERRRLLPVTGPDPPGVSLSRRDHTLVDLTGDGLPDVLQLNGDARWWRNRGDGVFDRPRTLATVPSGPRLSDPDAALIDVTGDGRADLSVTTGPFAGYVPLRFGPSWGRHRRYSSLPPAGLADPAVRLVDLTGDGVSDAVLLGDRLSEECARNR
jgi:hypothetical protein